MRSLYTGSRHEAPPIDLAALVDQIIWELNDRRFLGRTSARKVRAGTRFPFAPAPVRAALYGADIDEDCIPLAWSCWEMSAALANRLHAEGIDAVLVPAHEVEGDAAGDPHVVVLLESHDGERYLADPYFDVGAVLLDQSRSHSWAGPHATALAKSSARTGSAELAIRHIALPRPYRYLIVEDARPVHPFALIDDAPTWVRGACDRSLRVTIDHVVVRVADAGRSVETTVWDLSHPTDDPALSWVSTTWEHAARDVVALTQIGGLVDLATVRRSRIRAVS